MKKSIALMLTFSLLLTAMPLASVQAVGGKEAAASKGKDAERGGESYRDRRAKSEDRDRGIDRDSERNRYRSKSEDRYRDRDESDKYRDKPIKDPRGLPLEEQDPVRTALDDLEGARGQEAGKRQTNDKSPKDITIKDIKNMKFTFVGNAKSFGGHDEKYIMRDQNGDEWLFRYNGEPGYRDWVADAEVGANKLLKALGQPSVEIENVTLDIPKIGTKMRTVSGSIQKIIELQSKDIGMGPDYLNNEQRKQLQEAQIIDYLIANGDAHLGNFAIDLNRNIIGLDKAKSLDLRYNGDEITDNSHNLGPYYLDLWTEWFNNKYEMDFMAVEPLLEKIEGLSDSEFQDMFRSYAEGREKETGDSAKKLLEFLVERKKTIRSKIEAFYKELVKQKAEWEG